MRAKNNQLWFKTDKFEIHPDEDGVTNPGCYGQELAEFLRSRLSSEGYQVREVIPEDWGWCIVGSRQSFHFLIGCANMDDHNLRELRENSGLVPKGSDVVWTCFVVDKTSLFSRLFKRIDTKAQVEKLVEGVHHILSTEVKVDFVDQS